MFVTNPFVGRIAQKYDRWYETPWGAWAEGCEWRLFERMATPEAGEIVVDVGCGTGRGLAQLARAGCQVVGVDVSGDMLAVARQRLEEEGLAARLVLADATKLPLQKASADLVYSTTMLEFVPEPAKALREMGRVARGRVFVGVLGRWSLMALYERLTRSGGPLDQAHFFTPPELLRLAAQALPGWSLQLRTALVGYPFSGSVGAGLARGAEALHCPLSPLGGYLGLIARRPTQ